MNFQQLNCFALELTYDEQSLLQKELEDLDEKYWEDSLEDLHNNATFLPEFYLQYTKEDAYDLMMSLQVIPDEHRTKMLNTIYCSISNELGLRV